MNGLLNDKAAVVLGAGRGIGAGIARVFAAAGARVLVGDVNGDQAAATAAWLGDQHASAVIDVASKADIDAGVAKAVETFGGLDILVQNAGIFPWTTIEDTPPDEWDQVLAVNLRSCFLAAQACLEPMRARGGGRMIFTSSITGPKVSSPGHGHYAASKGGINGLIRTAALEFAPDRITVNGVEPGNIFTEGMKATRSEEFIRTMEASVPLGRLGTPEDIGNACLFLASDLGSYITGTTIVVDGGQIVPEGGNFAIAPS